MQSFNFFICGFALFAANSLHLTGQNNTSVSELGIPRNPVFNQSMNESTNESTRGSITYCEYNQPGNSFESGRISMHDVYTNVNQSADDFDVPANSCMVLSQVISNHMSVNNLSSVNIYIYDDNAGNPNNLIASYIGVSYTFNNIGSAFGLTVREITAYLPQDLELCGGPTGTKYWISVTCATGSFSYWEFQTITNYGLSGRFKGIDFGVPNWTNYGDNFVFKLNYKYKSELYDTIKLCGLETVNINGSDYDYPCIVDEVLTSSTGCDSIAPVCIIKDFGVVSTLESGKISMHDVYTNINQCADDFIVPANECIIVESVHANFLIGIGASISSVIVYFYDDNSGAPGNLLLQDTVSAFATNYLGDWFGMLDIQHVRADLTTPFELCSSTGSTKYWMSITVASGNLSYWEFINSTTINSPSYFKGVDFGTPTWLAQPNDNMVFSFDYRYKVDITPPAELSYCTNHDPIILAGTPAGGTFTGPGMSGNQFNPGSASIGTNEIIYTYVAPDGCGYSDTLTLNVSACAGIDELPTLNLQAFPNPTNGIFYLSGFSVKNVPFTWQIMNIAGQFISGGNDVLNSGENQISFDLSGLASGTYFLKIQTEEGDQVLRIIKN